MDLFDQNFMQYVKYIDCLKALRKPHTTQKEIWKNILVSIIFLLKFQTKGHFWLVQHLCINMFSSTKAFFFVLFSQKNKLLKSPQISKGTLEVSLLMWKVDSGVVLLPYPLH
jgi:hypothetical protein